MKPGCLQEVYQNDRRLLGIQLPENGNIRIERSKLKHGDFLVGPGGSL
jgi:hypothetical protein